MIERKMTMNYETREATLEELEAEYAHLKEKIKQKKQDEAERKRAELALEKEARKKEVDAARDHYYALLQAYISDYHSYENLYKGENAPLSKIFELFM